MGGGTGQNDEARHRSACGGSGDGLRCEEKCKPDGTQHPVNRRGGECYRKGVVWWYSGLAFRPDEVDTPSRRNEGQESLSWSQLETGEPLYIK